MVFANFLDAIGMRCYYPQKLRYEDVIKLTSDQLDRIEQKPTRLSDLPWYFMKHIIGLDSSARENCYIESSNVTYDPISDGFTEVTYDAEDDNDEEIISDEETSEEPDGQTEEELDKAGDEGNIHPLDLIYAIFLCGR